MKILDIEKCGNVLRFYLGNAEFWTFDDGDDAPYEHNAGIVYDEYVEKTVDVGFSLDKIILEPADDWHYNWNSPFCKDDFKKVPFMIIEERDDYGLQCYSDSVKKKDVIKITLGDEFDDKNYYGGTVLKA